MHLSNLAASWQVLHDKILDLQWSTFHDSSTCVKLRSQNCHHKHFSVTFLNENKPEAARNLHHSKTKLKTWRRQTPRTSILRNFKLDWWALTKHQRLTGNQRTADDSLCCKLEEALLALQSMDLLAGTYSPTDSPDDLLGDYLRCVQ